MSVRLSPRPLSISRAGATLDAPGAGGVALFAGRVRPDRTPTGTVVALDYEVDRSIAMRVLGELEREAVRRFHARAVVVWHRVGRVPVGEVAVIVGAACGHRSEAFDATRFLIEEVKRTVPIWKSERGRRGRRRRRSPLRPAGRSAD